MRTPTLTHFRKRDSLLRVFCWTSVCALLVCGLVVGCTSKSSSPNSIKSEMRSAYQTTYALFTYVWDLPEFLAPENESRILRLLETLRDRFHRVEEVAPIREFEPGFRIALLVHQDALKDITQRFQEGKKEYANWRLRGLINNCIACHSRYDVPVNFLGDAPPLGAKSFDEQLARAEFLLASRQVDSAAEDLIQLARLSSRSPTGGDEFLEAMKLWLVIQVRMKRDLPNAVRILAKETTDLTLSDYNHGLVDRWLSDLKSLPPLPASEDIMAQFSQAHDFLKPLRRESTVEEDELNLVPTLRATTILHQLLLRELDTNEKRTATALLAQAYVHLPIGSFDVFAPLYLEQCIREFPESREAEECYLALQKRTEFDNTGSSGLHMDEETQTKLRKLRAMAYGNEGVTLQDSAPAQ